MDDHTVGPVPEYLLEQIRQRDADLGPLRPDHPCWGQARDRRVLLAHIAWLTQRHQWHERLGNRYRLWFDTLEAHGYDTWGGYGEALTDFVDHVRRNVERYGDAPPAPCDTAGVKAWSQRDREGHGNDG